MVNFLLLSFPHLDLFHSNLFHLLGQAAPVTPLDVTAECLRGTFGPDSAGLNCSSELSKLTAQQWENIWQQKVGQASPEFLALMNISRYIAGPAVALWGISAIRDLYRNGIAEGWQRLAAVVVLVFVLYSGDAEVMRQTTLAMRSLMNYQNQIVLDLTNAGSQYEQKLAEMADYRLDEDAVREYRAQCNGKTSNEELLACLNEADKLAVAKIEEYEKAHPGSKWIQPLKNFAEGAIKNPIGVLTKAITSGTVAAIAGPVGGLISAGFLSNSGSTLITNGILAGMNYVAQNVVELSWLFTAIIVPVPLSLAFYPGGKGALIGWAVGFLTIGLFKINMNIASSLIVSMLYDRGPGAGTTDLMLLSVGVIFIASLMTAGGGYAIFNGIMTAVTTATLGIARLGVSAASGGIAR